MCSMSSEETWNRAVSASDVLEFDDIVALGQLGSPLLREKFGLDFGDPVVKNDRDMIRIWQRVVDPVSFPCCSSGLENWRKVPDKGRKDGPGKREVKAAFGEAKVAE